MSKRTHLGVRAAALTCSIALVGAYLVYRSGDLLMPSTKSGRVVGPDDDAPDELLPGSKSAIVQPAAPATQPAERRVFPGSKSAILTEPVRDLAPATAPTTAPATQRPNNP